MRKKWLLSAKGFVTSSYVSFLTHSLSRYVPVFVSLGTASKSPTAGCCAGRGMQENSVRPDELVKKINLGELWFQFSPGIILVLAKNFIFFTNYPRTFYFEILFQNKEAEKHFTISISN